MPANLNGQPTSDYERILLPGLSNVDGNGSYFQSFFRIEDPIGSSQSLTTQYKARTNVVPLRVGRTVQLFVGGKPKALYVTFALS